MSIPTTESRDAYRWELLAMLFCAFFFHQADRAIFGVVLPAIKDDLKLSDAALGTVGSALFFTLAVMMPLAGYLGDVWSKKWTITCSLVFWSGATMLTGLAHGVGELIAFRSVATAGGESFYAPAAYSLLAAYHKTTRALAMAIHQSSLYLGVMVSGFLGGMIAQQYGWRSAFYIFGGGGIVLGGLFMLRLRDLPRAEPEEGVPRPTTIGPLEALSTLFRVPTALLVTAGFTAVVFVNNAYVVWAPAFVGEKFGLSLTEAGGYAMLYHHLAALVGVLIGGRLSDAMAVRRPVFRLEMQTVALLLGAPAILSMALATSVEATWWGMAAFGLCRGFFESNTHASLFEVIAPQRRASAVGIMTMLAFMFGSLSPWLLGHLRSVTSDGQGLSLGFAILSAAYGLGGFAMLAAATLTFRKDRCVEEEEMSNVEIQMTNE